MRTLPLRLAPVEGESLPGYITRYAGRFDLQPRDVVHWLGLDDGGTGPRAAGRYGLSLAAEQLERAAHASGLEPATLEGMLLAGFAGRAFAQPRGDKPVTLAREISARELSAWTTRLCPRCLCEDGAWRVRWQLCWSVACPRHRVLLVRRCPRCGTPPQVGLRPRWPRDRAGELTDTARCAHLRRQGSLCRGSLTGGAARVAATPAIVAAQRRIDAVLDGHLTPRLAGEELEAPVYLHDLRVLAMLKRPDTRSRLGSRAERVCGGSGRPLDDPVSLAVVLPAALELADLPDRDALVDALRVIANHRYHGTQTTLGQLTRRLRTSPILAAALRAAASQSIYANPSARIGLDHRAHRRPEDLDHRLEARHVPQLFWADDYDRHLAELFDFDDFSARLGRRFCSIVLARMLAPLDWQAAVRHLDFSERFHNLGYNTTFVKLRQADRFDELAARIKCSANQHAQHELVDYEQRRQLLADWNGIDPATWRLIAPRIHARNPDTPTRASLWLWCQLTSGHEHAAPIAPPNPALHRQTMFERRHLDALREPLTLLGELLLNTPADARRTLTNRLAATLHRHGHLHAQSWLRDVDPLIIERILAHVSARTGVDIATLTTPQRGSRAPAAVTHARLLTGALLRDTAHASWGAIAAAIGGRPQRLSYSDRVYRSRLEHTPTLAAELEQLARAIEDWHTPAPVAPTEPHHDRMHAIATSIKARASDLFTSTRPSLMQAASIVACRAHTDLSWPQLAALHQLPKPQASWANTTINGHCRNDPDTADRYNRLLNRAAAVRDAAGYANAHLVRGLTGTRTRPPQEAS
jgi:hypothetical protein